MHCVMKQVHVCVTRGERRGGGGKGHKMWAGCINFHYYLWIEYADYLHVAALSKLLLTTQPHRVIKRMALTWIVS